MMNINWKIQNYNKNKKENMLGEEKILYFFFFDLALLSEDRNPLASLPSFKI